MGNIVDTWLGVNILRGVHWPTHTLGYEWVDSSGNHFFCETLERARNSILRHVKNNTL